MRIAQIAPIVESVPPEKYGGTERVISALTEELVKRGHDVTLFASGNSHTSANLFSIFPTGLRNAGIENIYGTNIWSLLNVGLAYQLQDKFDVIHDHNGQSHPVSFPIANVSQTPVVVTLHGPLGNKYGKTLRFYTNPHLVSISYKQREGFEDLNFMKNIYHGLPMKGYTYSLQTDGYLLFVGRVHVQNGVEEKGLCHAITIAEKLDMPLLIAAKLDTTIPEDVAYFAQVIKPHLSEKIKWLGEVDEKTRNKLMSRAVCLLHTINFSEPFGLTLIEAMACACPVIAFAKGSIPEIIQDRKSGYVVETAEEAVSAIKKITTIDRLYCRQYSLKRFSVERMVDEYESIYEKISYTRTVPKMGKRLTRYTDKLLKKLLVTIEKM